MTESLPPSATSTPEPPSQIHADFIVGCDGARSLVRKAIDANLQGTPIIQRVQSTYIHAPSLLALMDAPAWMTLSLNPRRCGTVVAIDGRENWLIHNHLNKEDETFESVDRDASIRAILGVGPDFEYEILSKEDWVGRRLVADRFRKGRAFICGDAAHLWMPYAGYGMNAGIADATNLAWLLAAYLQGWADIAILDAYEAERLPITEQVSRFAMDMAGKVLSQRRTVPDAIEQPGPEGDAVRQQVGQAAYDLNVQQYCCAGLNFGYFYDRSPIIAYDGAEQPGFTMADFTPSSTPGCRLPFAKLADGRPVYDALGPGYTLLRYDPDVAVAPSDGGDARQRRAVRGRRCRRRRSPAARRPQTRSWRAPTSTWPGGATPSLTIPRISSASCSAKTSTSLQRDHQMTEARSQHRLGIALVVAAAVALEHRAVLHAAASLRFLDHPVLARAVRRRHDHGPDGAVAGPRQLAGSGQVRHQWLAGGVVLDAGDDRLHPLAAAHGCLQCRDHHRDRPLPRGGAGLDMAQGDPPSANHAGERRGACRRRHHRRRRTRRLRHSRRCPRHASWRWRSRQ